MRDILFVFLLLLHAALTRAESQEYNDDEAVVGPMIVGGVDVDDGRYEFFVQGNDCGGSLVAPDVVLSSARCKSRFAGVVYVGNYMLDVLTDGAQSQNTESEMVTHPDYDEVTHANDLMLFKIERSSLTPITLNNDTGKPINGSNLTFIGFGDKVVNGSSSETLQRAVMQHIPNDECIELLRSPPADDSVYYDMDGYTSVDDTKLCAMDTNNKSQTPCADNGSPLFYEENGNFTLMGVLSGGPKGCLPEYPKYYARMSYHQEWIQKTICDLTETSPEFCPSKPSSSNSKPSSSNIGIIVGSTLGVILLLLVLALFLGRKKIASRLKKKNRVNVSQTSESSGRLDSSLFTPEIVVQPHDDDDVSTIGDPIPFGVRTHMGVDEKTASVAMDYDYSNQFRPARLDAGSTSDASKSMMSYTAETSDIAGGKRGLILIDDDSFGLQYHDEEERHHEENLTYGRVEVQAPSGKLGMVIDTLNNGIPTVRELKNESVLMNQVKVGDQLILVNGVNVRRMTAQEVSRFINLKSDQPRELVFHRPYAVT